MISLNIKNEIQDVKDACAVISSKAKQFKSKKEKYNDSYREEDKSPKDNLDFQIKILQRMCKEVSKFAKGIEYYFERAKTIKGRIGESND